MISVDPLEAFLTAKGRTINLPFALAELVWILSGNNKLDLPVYYNSGYKNYSKDGRTLYGAYGIRMRDVDRSHVDQLAEVIRKLRADGNTRQAVITYWNPSLDNIEGELDYPCNNWSHALIRDGKLEWTQLLRSNDIIWGMPYNFIQFATIQNVVAAQLGIDSGRMTYIADSLHIYEDKLNESDGIELFDMYDKLSNSRNSSYSSKDYYLSSNGWELMGMEHNMRTSLDVAAAFDPYAKKDIGIFWQDVMAVLQCFILFKNKQDEEVFNHLPHNRMFAYMLLKNFYQWRWHKESNYTYILSLMQSYLSFTSFSIVNWIQEGKVLEHAE